MIFFAILSLNALQEQAKRALKAFNFQGNARFEKKYTQILMIFRIIVPASTSLIATPLPLSSESGRNTIFDLPVVQFLYWFG